MFPWPLIEFKPCCTYTHKHYGTQTHILLTTQIATFELLLKFPQSVHQADLHTVRRTTNVVLLLNVCYTCCSNMNAHTCWSLVVLTLSLHSTDLHNKLCILTSCWSVLYWSQTLWVYGRTYWTTELLIVVAKSSFPRLLNQPNNLWYWIWVAHSQHVAEWCCSDACLLYWSTLAPCSATASFKLLFIMF